MAINWTDEQKNVIEGRGRSTLVSAAAGSGKTAVLVEHIISLITDKDNPVDIDSILVVTFTNNAAYEMRERILAAIEEQSALDPGNEHLIKQQTYIHNAKICTIDSFCKYIVTEYFDELDIDPGFKIVDENEISLIKADVLDELLEDYYKNGSEDFFAFVDEFASGKTDDNIADCIGKLYNYISSRPDPEEWLNMCRADYNIDTADELKDARYIKYLTEYVDEQLRSQLKRAGELKGIVERYPELDAYKPAAAEAERIVNDLLGLDFDARVDYLTELSFDKLKRAGNLSGEAETARDLFQKIRNKFKDDIKELKDDVYAVHLSERLSDITGCRASANVLIDLTLDFMRRFREKKAEKNVLSFADTEQFAYSILVDRDENGNRIPSARARELADKYVEIIIDEYQDSNLLQEYILSSLQGGQGKPNMFMVGDIKQSIYRFRHAVPDLFIQKYNTYDSDKEALHFKQSLGKNFRSRREIIDSVNAVFSSIMTKNMGGIDYDEENCLYEGAGYPDAADGQEQSTEILLIDNDDRARESEEYEAYVVAKKIIELMDPKNGFKVFDKKLNGYRPARYRDIVVLDRKNNDIYTKVFSKMNIPSYMEQKTGFLESLEIQTMLNLLTAINNPLDDIPLAAVMKSPIYGFTSADFAEICAGERCEYFYDSIKAYSDGGTDESLKRRCVFFLKKLDGYRKLVPYTPIYDLIETLFIDTNYYNYVTAMPDGRQRRKNLDVLYDKAVAYDDGSYKGLFKFVKYIENIKDINIDYGEAPTLGENDDVVRIMTMHKSKGLQFPIVFLARLGRELGRSGNKTTDIQFHSKLGIGITNVDSIHKIKTGTLMQSAIEYAEKKEERAEEMRILYVSMTRAEEKLFLVATKKDAMRTLVENAEIAPSDGDIMDAVAVLAEKSFIDLIFAALNGKPESDNFISTHVISKSEDFRDDYIFARGLSKEKLDEMFESKNTDASETAEKIKKRLDFEYAYIADTKMQSKTSVSKLKVRAMEFNPETDGIMLIEGEYGDTAAADGAESNEPVKPEFVAGKQKLVGADRGTAYHRVFEIFDFTAGSSNEDIKNMLDKMRDTGRIDDDTYDVVKVSDLVKFANSRLGKSMRAAAKRGKLFREQPFVMGIPAENIDKNCSAGELVLVQGIIDACFEEDGEMVIADYKTDNVNNIGQLADRYRAQLDYYERAITQITGKKVKEKIIYSVKFGEELVL